MYDVLYTAIDMNGPLAQLKGIKITQNIIA